MLSQVTKIDKKGRIELPQKMREAIGLFPEKDVLLELTDNGIFIKPKLATTPISQRIADMELPVSDWYQMEREIEEGHLN